MSFYSSRKKSFIAHLHKEVLENSPLVGYAIMFNTQDMKTYCYKFENAHYQYCVLGKNNWSTPQIMENLSWEELVNLPCSLRFISKNKLTTQMRCSQINPLWFVKKKVHEYFTMRNYKNSV